MKQFVALGFLSVLLSGCMTTDGFSRLNMTPEDTVYVLVKSDPDGATISFLDGTECQTPCRVGIDGPLQMTVARAGYAAERYQLTKRSKSPLTVQLDPVARTVPVEEVSLPDL
ncbi:MAG: hypothetical protein AAF603_09285 [Pseudomonadota bacterium]